MAKKVKKWIPKDLDEGAFTEKARRAGMSVQEFANKVMANPEKYDQKTVKQANLARTFQKMARRRKKK